MSGPDALTRLDVLAGEWELEASLAPGVLGRATFEWALDGQFLLERSSFPGAPDSIAIVAVDSDGDGYTQHYYDSRGVVRLYAMTFSGGDWVLLRTTPDFSPLNFSQRYVGRLSADGRTVDGRWETSQDGGATWERDFTLTYRRPA